jgi:hypothetical protein
VNLLHGVFKVEHRALTDTGPAAADVDRGHRRRIENDSGDSGCECLVIGVTDADAGDIGEKVLQHGVCVPAGTPAIEPRGRGVLGCPVKPGDDRGVW